MAQYEDTDKKFTVVLNKNRPLAELMNALGHMAVGLTAQTNDPASMRFLCYEDADGGRHPSISYYPFIVLAAKNSNQLRTLRQAAIDAQLVYNDFTHTMLGASAEDQLRATASTPERDLEYLGVILFGPSAVINSLTRKFSLLKGE
jgi:hypothetical protein